MTTRSLVILSFLALLEPIAAVAAWRIVYRDANDVQRTIIVKSANISVDDTIFRSGFE